jgi:hypothetical protein
VDQSALTGESKDVDKALGAVLSSGSVAIAVVEGIKAAVANLVDVQNAVTTGDTTPAWRGLFNVVCIFSTRRGASAACVEHLEPAQHNRQITSILVAILLQCGPHFELTSRC